MSTISIAGTRWLIDGSITYPGAADDPTWMALPLS